jgi:hypothetical protein
LYFSCKNKKELAQARITKVVVSITTDQTKLVSQFSEFSVIFYTIYKNQINCNTIGVTLLRIGPWKELKTCNVALGLAGRRGLPKSGEAGAGSGRGRGGGGPRGL